MKILMTCRHNYPAFKAKGVGDHPSQLPSGSGMHLHDLLVKGLAEKGHEVYYHLPSGISEALPFGVKWVEHLPEDIDICHYMSRVHAEVGAYYRLKGIPVLATNHLFLENDAPEDKWIHVSPFLAQQYNSTDFVTCGLNPEDYIYSTQKSNYLLFISDLSRYKEKGLEKALSIAQQSQYKLVVAGTSKNQEDIDVVKSWCAASHAQYIGDIRGMEKALWISRAKALISPSTQMESFGLTLVEAMFSGTPVLASDVGAYKDVVSPEVGFICLTDAEFLTAISQLDTIQPKACRARAMEHFHYLRMTDDYIKIYEQMIQHKEVHFDSSTSSGTLAQCSTSKNRGLSEAEVRN